MDLDSGFDVEYKSVFDLNIEGKTLATRVDMNVPLSPDGLVLDNERIVRSLDVVSYALEKGCSKVVLVTHIGRPNGGAISRELSVANIADEVSRLLGFVVDVAFDTREARLSRDRVVMLENIRFSKNLGTEFEEMGEVDGNESLAKKLAEMCDYYVNNAFSCSHRAHSSISVVAKFTSVYAGDLLLRELSGLRGVVPSGGSGRDNFSGGHKVVIVGGSKVSTKISLLSSLVAMFDYVVVVGAMANTFLHALGYNIGKSLCESDYADTAREVADLAERSGCKLVLPRDFVVSDYSELASKEGCAEGVSVRDRQGVEVGDVIFDLGCGTINEIVEILGSASLLVWNGPLGMFEKHPFNVGTEFLARSVVPLVAGGTLRAVVGGGDTVCAIKRAGLLKGMSYVSTGGGAFLGYLEGIVLPGVSALLRK